MFSCSLRRFVPITTTSAAAVAAASSVGVTSSSASSSQFLSKSLLSSSSSSSSSSICNLGVATPFIAQAIRSCATEVISSSSNRRPFDNRRQNQQPRGGGGRRYGNRGNTTTYALAEFFDVRDSPKDGRELRLAFRQDSISGRRDSKLMTVTIRPQLGPRKSDPHDPTPQFDSANRVSIRLKPRELAAALHWMCGRSKANSFAIAGNTYKFEMSRTENALVIVSITGNKLDGTPAEPLSYELQPHQQVQMERFLEESLYCYWDLSSF